MNKGFAVVVVSSILVLILALPVYADYLDIGASNYANQSANVTIKGFIRLDNASGVNNTNITGFVGNSNFSVFTNTSLGWGQGFFEFNLTAPNATGYYNITFNTNTSLAKTITIYVSNLTNVAFNFTDKKPPFANGTSFLVNISFAGRTNVAPNLEIFGANGGNSTGWAINNVSSRINTPSILYNITVPANADGRYVMVFENGAGVTIFLVKSYLIAVVNTQDSTNSTTNSFGQGENITILGKIRDQNNPLTGAVVTAYITLPNGTVKNMTLDQGTGVDGTYNGTFADTSLVGDYKIEIVSNASGKILKSSSLITIQNLEAKLDIVKSFFFDFGSQSAFQKNGPVEFNVLVYNLSNDALLNGSLTPTASVVNCNSTRVAELKNSLNGSVLSSPGITWSTNLFTGQTVCKINFTAPSSDGIYVLTVNTTVGTQAANTTVLAKGYFSIQSYILKPSPVSSLGSGQTFMSFLMPGDNATFEITVRNLSASGGAAVSGNLITDFNVTKITPMSFTGGGQADITGITVLQYTSGTTTANPKIKIKIPENTTGPFQVEFQATVAGSVIRGTAFYVARYVDGFIFPANFGGGFGTGGPGGEGGPGGGPGGSSSGGNFKCSGSQNFSAMVKDVRTMQAARSVVFNSVQEAREEMTGKDVRSQITLSSSSSTDSNGFGNLTLGFSGSLSGFYFVLINITTSDGKSDALPGGFECKQLSFFPQVQAIGSTGGGFFVSPNSGLNVTISGIKNLNTGKNVQNGTARVASLENYDPTRGPKFVGGSVTTYNLSNGTIVFTLSPSDFSGLSGKWLNGFNNLRIRVCDNSTTPYTCDLSMGGFQVVAFDAFPDYSAGSPSTTLTAGMNISYYIMAKTNVSRENINNPTTTTGFTVQLGMPWEGNLQTATIVNTTLMSDGWNSSSDNMGYNGFERWNVTFTVPSNLRKGGNQIIIKVTNYLGESTDVMMFGTASKLSVSVPDTEGMFGRYYFVGGNVSNSSQVTDVYNNYGLNLSIINGTFKSTNSKSGRICVMRDFNVTRFTQNSQQVSYKTNVTIAIIDNETAGSYNTIIMNNSGSIAVANANNRSLASAGFPGLYFVNVEDCGFIKFLNSTIEKTGFGSGFAGQNPVSSNVVVPFVVKQGTTVKSAVRVDVFQIITQQDFGGGRGGFGFSDFLSTNNYTITPGTTDANGVAFMNINISKSGLYSILWNFTSGSDADTADFSDGVPIEIKAFMTDGGMLNGNHPKTFRVVTLTKNSTETRNATVAGSPIFIGTWDESTQGTFISDTTPNKYLYIALRNVTQQGSYGSGAPYTQIPDFTELIIDNDGNLNTSGNGEIPGTDTWGVYFGNWTETFGGNQPPNRNLFLDSLIVAGRKTVDENTTRLVFANPNTFNNIMLSNSGSSTRVYANITVKACAYTYSKPQTNVIGANVSGITTQTFSYGGPPTNENLTIFDPYTNDVTNSVLTGPSGCAVFNVTRSGGWRAGSPNEIKGTITSGSNNEQAWLGSIFVMCPSSGSCY